MFNLNVCKNLPQRRTKGNVDFYKDWKSYRDGFGDYGGDFFLGLEALHKLTSKVRKDGLYIN